MSSASNLLLLVSVARVAGPAEFGFFSIVYIVVFAFVGFARAIVGTVAAVVVSDWTWEEEGRKSGLALAAAIQIGLIGMAVLVAIAIVGPNEIRSLFLVAAVILPAVLAQDVGRFLAFALGRPIAAVAADGTWLGLQVLLLLITTGTTLTSAALLGMWGACSLPALIVVGCLLRVREVPIASIGWFHEQAALVRGLWVEGVVTSVAAQGAPLAAGFASSQVVTGQLRAVGTTFGPLVTLSTGLLLATVPAATRRYARGVRAWWTPLLVNSCILAGTVAVWTACVLLVPGTWGRWLLGENWTAVPTLALGQGALLAVSYLGDSALLSLRVMRAGKQISTIRSVSAGATIGGAFLGSLWDGASGALLLMVCAAAATSFSAWCLFLRRLRQSG